jgi:hypothetical protein
MNVYAVSVPFQDQVTASVRELELQFKVQEDISGVVTSNSLAKELAALKDGLGFTHNSYNTGSGDPTTQAQGPLGIPIPGGIPGLYTTESPLSSGPGGLLPSALGNFGGLGGLTSGLGLGSLFGGL